MFRPHQLYYYWSLSTATLKKSYKKVYPNDFPYDFPIYVQSCCYKWIHMDPMFHPSTPKPTFWAPAFTTQTKFMRFSERIGAPTPAAFVFTVGGRRSLRSRFWMAFYGGFMTFLGGFMGFYGGFMAFNGGVMGFLWGFYGILRWFYGVLWGFCGILWWFNRI